MSTRVAISSQWEQFNTDTDKLGARAVNLLNWGNGLFVMGAIAATSGFFIIIVIATTLLAWGMIMRRRVYRLRDIAALHQDQGVFPDSTSELSEAELNSHDLLYNAPKARENPISGFGSSNPVNNKRTDYSKEWAQLETEINELAQRANWIFKTTNIIYLFIIEFSFTVFEYTRNMRGETHFEESHLFNLMILTWIFLAILLWPLYLMMRSFCYSSLPYNYGLFFIEFFFVAIFTLTLSGLTHSPSTAITSVIIAVIAAYRLFGSYLGRRAKLLHRRLNPKAPRQTPLPLN